MTSDGKQISVAATAIALRGVRLFLTAGKAAGERALPQASQPTARAKPKKPVVAGNKPPQKVFDMLYKTTKFNNVYKRSKVDIVPHHDERRLSGNATRGGTGRLTNMPNKKLKEKHLDALYRLTHFTKAELEALYTMYRRLVIAAQAAAPASAIGSPPKIDGIDQNTFRDVMHNTFDLVTEEAILERMWMTWERGAAGGEGSLRFESWVRGLSVLLRGNADERRLYCFKVYDLNNDGFITRDEMFTLLRNALLKQPGDEDPDEGVRDLVELVLRKLDVDKDGRVSIDDYRAAIDQEPLLLEAFGQCLPSKRHVTAFLKTLVNKT